MSRGSLSGRLSRIRRMESSRPDPAPPAGVPTPPDDTPTADGGHSLDGWTEVAPCVFERITRYPAVHRRALSAHLPLLFPRERVALEKAFPLDPSRFRF